MLQGEHSAILSTFIKLSFVIEIFVLSIFEWPLTTGYTIGQDLEIFSLASLFSETCVWVFGLELNEKKQTVCNIVTSVNN